MASAKEALFEQLIPFFNTAGFTFLRSKNTFVRKANGIHYRVQCKFDGRGGLSSLDYIGYFLEMPAYNRLIKKLIGIGNVRLISAGINYSEDNTILIPPMHSAAAVTLANDMNLSALAKMPFEQKYPPARIKHCATCVIDLIQKRVLPFFKTYNTPKDIYNKYCITDQKQGPLSFYNDDGSIYFNLVRSLFIRLLAQDLQLPSPPILQQQKNFYTDMDSGFGYLGLTKDLEQSLQKMGITI